MDGLKHQKEKPSMDYSAGLDVLVKETSVCIVDDAGRIVRTCVVREGKSVSWLLADISLQLPLVRLSPNSGFMHCSKRYRVAVGTCVSSHAPRTEPYVRLSRIRLVWEFLCQGCITPFLSCFVASFFRSTRAASILPSRPHIAVASRAAAVKDGASSAPPKACP